VRARLEQAVATAVVAKDNCEGTLADAIEAEHEACAGQGENPNCLCDEARTAITDQTALCAAVTDTYEAVFCEHQVACSSFQQCHAQEMDVYTALRADIEAAMTSRQEEYRTFMQVDCLMNLITTAMLSGTPIDHASLVACDDVSVDHLAINFQVPPSAPTDCPATQSGDPQCDASGSPVESGFTVDGCARSGNLGEHPLTFHADESHTADVRCCSMNGSTCQSMDLPEGVDVGSYTGCVRDVTFSVAHDTCTAIGMRLCDSSEVEVCCNTGCSHNHHAIWVSHEAQHAD